MKQNARKLTALIMALAILLSFFVVAEDGMTEIDEGEPIEIVDEIVGEGETGDDGDTQEQDGELEIDMDEAGGLLDGAIDPEGGEELELSLDLNSEALETGEEELAPVTEEAMNAGDPIEINTWGGLQAALSNTVPTGESSTNPTHYKLTANITDTSSQGAIQVGSGRNVVLDLNGCTIDRNLSTAANAGGVITVFCSNLTITDSSPDKTGTITGGNNNFGGGVYVYSSNSSARSTFTMEGGTISGNTTAENGGGVYVTNYSTFTMKGGKISGNKTTGDEGVGGGVYVTGGTFTMSGNSEISNNKATGNEGGGVREYGCEIVRLSDSARPSARAMVIRVTDPGLLAVSGGIVQGMSGSPLIQDGRIIGAVTHVMVNDPAMGYGICIQTMLDAAEKAAGN